MAQPQTMNGYSKLASLMGAHSELANFRRFSTLNAQNLLYMQAELVFLENKLHKCVEADRSSGHADRAIYDRDWQSLFESGATAGGDGEQWDTALRIRKVLKEYNEASLLYMQLAKQDGPLARDMSYLQQWMKRTDMGCVYLLGADSDVYEKPELHELVTMKRHQGHGLATRVMADFGIRLWRKMFRVNLPPDMYLNTIRYSDNALTQVGEIIGTMCASMLPVLAIVILYFIQSMGRRLGAIAAFTFIFSAVLGVFSRGRRVEIFAATAGYVSHCWAAYMVLMCGRFAAVQVVFVSTTSGIGGDNVKTQWAVGRITEELQRM